MSALGIEIAGLRMQNPVWVGSSELTMDLDGIQRCVDAGAGAVVAKSINENPAAARQLDIADYVFVDSGHRPLATPEPGASLFNRSGLAQPPLDDWLRMLERAQQYAERRGSMVFGSVTVAGAEGAARLGHRMSEVVPALEVNIGAPHAREVSGAVAQVSETEATEALVAEVRRAVACPLFIKLPGGVPGIPGLAAAAMRGGADAVTMTGRHNGFFPSIDEAEAPVLESWGAYGGPWALPMSLYEVSKTFRAHGPQMPIVGTNGARTADDVLRFILSGATAVELVSAIWISGTRIISELIDDLDTLVSQRSTTRIADIVGDAVQRARAYAEIRPAGPRPEPWRR